MDCLDIFENRQNLLAILVHIQLQCRAEQYSLIIKLLKSIPTGQNFSEFLIGESSGHFSDVILGDCNNERSAITQRSEHHPHFLFEMQLLQFTNVPQKFCTF